MLQRGWFLVDVPNEVSAQAIVDVIQRYGVARALHLSTDPQCDVLLGETGRVAGCVLRVEADESERLRELRARMPTLPVLALSSFSSWELINTAQHLDIELAQWPVPMPNLVSFVQRALSASFLPHDGVARVVSELAEARALTAREVQILTYCLGDEPRKRVRRRLGIAENTLKTQVRSLLRKCDERSVDALAKNVLRAALLSRTAGSIAAASWRPSASRDAQRFAESA